MCTQVELMIISGVIEKMIYKCKGAEIHKLRCVWHLTAVPGLCFL